LILLTSCGFETDEADVIETESPKSEEIITGTQEYTDWSEESHSNDAYPDYETVFPQDSVNRIDIVIAPEEWEAMSEDMEGLYGEFGANAGQAWGGPGGGRGERPDFGEGGVPPEWFPADGEFPQWGVPPEGAFPADGERPERPEGAGGPGGGGLDSSSTEKPIYVESQVYMNGTQWYNVGIKYKGHSSLQSSWRLWGAR